METFGQQALFEPVLAEPTGEPFDVAQDCSKSGERSRTIVPAAETARDLWRKETEASGKKDKGNAKKFPSAEQEACGA